MKIRVRYDYPSAAVVTGVPTLDWILDGALHAAGINRMRPPYEFVDSERTIAALGFPRSANTYLYFWLKWCQRPDVRILDGRLTHSPIDVFHLARRGVRVLVPIRPPVPTCASNLVRANSNLSVSAVRKVLRSYRGWYDTVAKVGTFEHVTIVRFNDVIHAPWKINLLPELGQLMDEHAKLDIREFQIDLRKQLDKVEGQGLDQGNIPSSQMISLPHDARRELLVRANQQIRSPKLNGELLRAEYSYEKLLNFAQPTTND